MVAAQAWLEQQNGVGLTAGQLPRRHLSLQSRVWDSPPYPGLSELRITRLFNEELTKLQRRGLSKQKFVFFSQVAFLVSPYPTYPQS